MQRAVEATMLTTGFLKSGKTLKQVDDQMLATQKTIMDNPKLSKTQKNALLQRMAIQVSMVIPSPRKYQNRKTILRASHCHFGQRNSLIALHNVQNYRLPNMTGRTPLELIAWRPFQPLNLAKALRRLRAGPALSNAVAGLISSSKPKAA